MASCVLRIVIRLVLSFALLAFMPEGRLTAARAADAPSLGLIAGDPAGSETLLALEMADLFAAEASLRVIPKPGDAGLNNIAALFTDPGADIAFVSADALAHAQARDAKGTLSGRLELVLRLCPQDIHILARRGIVSIADLAGKPVNFGPAGSSSAVTAKRLFEALATEVEHVALDAESALAKLKDGAIAASVIVGAKPTPLISDIPADLGLHLLPVAFGPDTEAAFLPARFERDDYPNLVAASTPVPTLATGMMLLAAKAKDDTGSAERIARFVDTLFSRFADLQAADKHPQWRNINLAAILPSLVRTEAAEVWLAERASGVAPMTASAAGATGPSLTSENQREALFKQFIEWRRAKGH